MAGFYPRAPMNIDGVPYNDHTSTLPTYNAGFTFVATTGTLLHLTGSATKIIAIRGMSMTGTAATVGSQTYQIRKTSTAPTGGTSTLVTPVLMDSLDAAPTASLSYYTAAPTAGTSLGSAFTFVHFFPTTSGGQGESQLPRDLAAFQGAAPIVLRGANEGMSLFTASTALSTLNLSISISWTETDRFP